MRNKNLEAFRFLAIVGMLVYHFTLTIFESNLSYNMSLYIEAIGQFSLICFFVLSGYGLYLSFKKKKTNFKSFIKKRLLAILPLYYISLAIILLLTSSSGFFALDKIKYVLESIFLVNNFDVNNSINGVTWTIAVFMQFYFIAIPIYNIIKKYDFKGYLIFLAFVILLKRLLYIFIYSNGVNTMYLPLVSIRNPITTIDLFAIGMLGAKHINDFKIIKNNKVNICLVLFLICLYPILFLIFEKYVGNIYADRFISSVWPSVLGIMISFILFISANIKLEWKNILGKLVQFIAKNEYGIYLWHMKIIGSFMIFSPLYLNLKNYCPLLLLIIMLVIAIIFGCCYMIFIDTSTIFNKKGKMVKDTSK